MKRLSLILVLAALGLTAACGSGNDGGGSASPSASDDHNAADISFAQGMIPHHEQAVEMADMALEKADSAEVKDLATRIKAAQAPEIKQMKGWLEDWDASIEAKGTSGGMAEHGGGAKGDGMMDAGEMKKLDAASGAEFDEMFLTSMLAHHKGAVAMAKVELAEGKFPDAKELAQNIVSTQEEEITEIESLLSKATPTSTP